MPYTVMKIKGQIAEVWTPERLALTLWGWLGAAYRNWTATARGSNPLSSTLE